MAHYLEIHICPKEVAQYAKVLDFCAEGLNEKLTRVLSVTRCSFNDLFREFFNVPSTEWDCNYHVLDHNAVLYLIEDLTAERATAEFDDKEDYTKVIETLKQILDAIETSEFAYLISWDK